MIFGCLNLEARDERGERRGGAQAEARVVQLPGRAWQVWEYKFNVQVFNWNKSNIYKHMNSAKHTHHKY